jgi:hypothetical protein
MTNAAISRRLHISLWMAFFEDVDGQILALMAQVWLRDSLQRPAAELLAHDVKAGFLS